MSHLVDLTVAILVVNTGTPQSLSSRNPFLATSFYPTICLDLAIIIGPMTSLGLAIEFVPLANFNPFDAATVVVLAVLFGIAIVVFSSILCEVTTKTFFFMIATCFKVAEGFGLDLCVLKRLCYGFTPIAGKSLLIVRSDRTCEATNTGRPRRSARYVPMCAFSFCCEELLDSSIVKVP